MAAPVASLWWNRIAAAERIWREEAQVWDALEKAVDGQYADVTGEAPDDALLGTPLEDRLRNGSQLDVNLLGQGRDYHHSMACERFPSWRWAEQPTIDIEASEYSLKIIRRLADHGDLVYAMKRAMSSG